MMIERRDGKWPMDESSDKSIFPRIKNPNPNRVKKVQQIRNEDPRDCSICCRRFSSGKALGGHMRVHGFSESISAAGEVQLSSNKVTPDKTSNITLSKNLKLVIKDSSKQIDDVSLVDVDVATDYEQWCETCMICGQHFHSLKSLFEHNTLCQSEKEVVDSNSGDGSFDINNLKFWSRKGKRSERNPLISHEVRNAALILMSMNRESFKIDEIERIRKGKSPAFLENRNPLNTSSLYDPGLSRIGGGDDKDRSFKGKSSSSSISPMKKRSSPKTKDLAKIDRQLSYKCNICYKAFASYQALGGHRSSHNKPKNQVLDINTAGSSSKTTVNRASDIPHQCTLCSRVFPSGQALGGHKRCHWSDQDSNWELSQFKKFKKVHEFDLNQPATMEEENPYYVHEEEEDEDGDCDGDIDEDDDNVNGTSTSSSPSIATSSSS